MKFAVKLQFCMDDSQKFESQKLFFSKSYNFTFKTSNVFEYIVIINVVFSEDPILSIHIQ